MENFEEYENKENQNIENNVKEENAEMPENDVQDAGVTAEEKTLKKKKDRWNFIKRHQNAFIASSCLLLGAAGGFGGTMAAIHLSGGNKLTGTVLYQSVVNTSTNTTSASTAGVMSVKEVAAAVSNSVVEIQTEIVSTGSYFRQAITSGAGSGVILSTDGYIITNNHVIEGASKITVVLKDGTSYDATLVGTDSATDLAVIKIDAADLTPAVMGSSDSLEVGDTAIAIGNPLGELGGTVTSGIISALDREITIDNQTMTLLQTNAAINPGNSGGGLFNDHGELIGIVNAKSSGDDVEGLGFAIPIDHAKDIITNLIENGYVKGRGALGVSLTLGTSSNPIENKETYNVYIVDVTKGMGADIAGLQAGDMILKIDDVQVTNISDIKNVINAKKAGETVTLTILRDNETKTFKVTLSEAN